MIDDNKKNDCLSSMMHHDFEEGLFKQTSLNHHCITVHEMLCPHNKKYRSLSI